MVDASAWCKGAKNPLWRKRLTGTEWNKENRYITIAVREWKVADVSGLDVTWLNRVGEDRQCWLAGSLLQQADFQDVVQEATEECSHLRFHPRATQGLLESTLTLLICVNKVQTPEIAPSLQHRATFCLFPSIEKTQVHHYCLHCLDTYFTAASAYQ